MAITSGCGLVQVTIVVDGSSKTVTYPLPPDSGDAHTVNEGVCQAGGMEERACPKGGQTYRLEELAYMRSGDKGNTANIGRCGEGGAIQLVMVSTIKSRSRSSLRSTAPYSFPLTTVCETPPINIIISYIH